MPASSTAWSACGAPTSTNPWRRSPPPLPDLRLFAVGRIGRGPEAELFQRYADRLRPRLTVIEITEARGNPLEIKRREAALLLAALPVQALAVALDLGGSTLTSEAFSRTLAAWTETGKTPCFLIGGAEGLDASVLARADHTLSLGSFTWPHMLVRVMLVEQLFRAQAIAAGHPYHRAGRP